MCGVGTAESGLGEEGWGLTEVAVTGLGVCVGVQADACEELVRVGVLLQDFLDLAGLQRRG